MLLIFPLLSRHDSIYNYKKINKAHILYHKVRLPTVFVLGCSYQLQLLMVGTHYSWGFGVSHYSWGFGEKQNSVRLMTQLYHKVSDCHLNVLTM